MRFWPNIIIAFTCSGVVRGTVNGFAASNCRSILAGSRIWTFTRMRPSEARSPD